MNPNRYTEKTQEALLAAQQIAERGGHPEVTPEHLLLSLLLQKDGVVPAVLGKMGVNVAALAKDAEGLVAKLPAVKGGAQPGISPRTNTLLTNAEQEAERLKDEFTSTEHLLLAMAGDGGRSPLADALKKRGVTRDAIFQALTAVRGSQRVTDQNPEGKYQALERYGRDLTEVARKGKLDPVIGRDDEIRRVIQVLPDAPRTTPCSSASPASARPRSWKDWRSALCAATCPKACATSASSPWTWARSSPAPSTAANSKSG